MGCLTASFNRDGNPRLFIGLGLGALKVDVFGVRGVKERSSRWIEGIAVEVKRSRSRTSLRSMVQASQYSRLAHRCYLAQPRAFDRKDCIEAARLGVGLLQISGNKIRTISESRPSFPELETFELFLHKSLRLVRCSLCCCHVHRYQKKPTMSHVSGYSIEDHATPLRRKSTMNKRMYLCSRCKEVLRREIGAKKMTDAIERMQSQLLRVERKLESL
jgi:hypothetical protein